LDRSILHHCLYRFKCVALQPVEVISTYHTQAAVTRKGATEISPVLTARSYAGETSHKIILPLFTERGDGQGEKSKNELAAFYKPFFTRRNLCDHFTASRFGCCDYKTCGIMHLTNFLRLSCFGHENEVTA
jgi:hypothetical protein